MLSKKRDRTICVPIELVIPDEMHGAFPSAWDEKYSHGEHRTYLAEQSMSLLRFHVSLIHASSTLTSEQKEEILSKLDDPGTIHIRNFHGRAQGKFYETLRHAHETQCSPSEHVSDQDTFNFMVTYPGFKHHRNVILVVLYTQSPGLLQHTVLTDRIAETTGKSMFSTHETSSTNIGIRLNPDCTHSVERFENSLSELIGISSEISFDSTFRFDKGTFGYIDRKKNKIQEICKTLSEKHKVTVTPVFTRTLAVSTGFTLKSIAWK
jgi:hypothetical protein